MEAASPVRTGLVGGSVMAVVLALAGATAAAGKRNGEPGRRAEKAGAPAAEPATTLPSGLARQLLSTTQGYARWPVFAEYRQKPKESRAHWNLWVVAHYNEIAAPAATGERRTYPEGSVLVKEHRSAPDGRTTMLTTMIKRQGGWYWLQHTPEGRLLVVDGKPAAGPVESCVACHGQAGQEMVFSGGGK